MPSIKQQKLLSHKIAAAPLLSSHQSELDPEGHQPYFDLCLNAYTEVELATAHAILYLSDLQLYMQSLYHQQP